MLRSDICEKEDNHKFPKKHFIKLCKFYFS